MLETITLRPYQFDAVKAIADNYFDHGLRRQLVVLATGLGKTIVAAHLPVEDRLAEYIGSLPEDGRRILVLSHRDFILRQLAKAVSRVNGELVVEIEQAHNRATSKADVVVASVQTLSTNRARLEALGKDEFAIFVIDEAHHSVAKSYIKILQYFGVLPPDQFWEDAPDHDSTEEALTFQRDRIAAWDASSESSRALLVGFTATPVRSDGIGLEAVYQNVAYEMNIRQGIEQGYLAPPRAIKVSTKTHLDHVKAHRSDFTIDALGEAINTDYRNEVVVQAWCEHASSMRTMAYTANVKHAHDLAERFRASGITAEAVDGETSEKERARIDHDFATGKLQVICNFGIYTEGLDVPGIECVLMARPTKSQTVYVQCIGRGLRLQEGKDSCLIIDFVDIARKHSLVTLPTLFGLPAHFDSKGKKILDAVEEVEKAKEERPALDVDAIDSVEDLHLKIEEIDLWAHAAHSDTVSKHATMQWLELSPDRFRIYLPSGNGKAYGETIEVLKLKNGQYVGALWGQGGSVQALGTPAANINGAFDACESWIKTNRPKWAGTLDQKAHWRKLPPSEGQLSEAKSRGIPAHLAKNRGQLADMLSIYYERNRRPENQPVLPS